MSGWHKILALAYVLVLFGVAVRLDRDEARRTRAGEFALLKNAEAQSKWDRVLHGDDSGQALSEAERLELDRLRVTVQVLGWAAVAEMGEPEVKQVLERLVMTPAGHREGAQAAVSAAMSDDGMAMQMDYALEKAPLTPLMWRNMDGSSLPWGEAVVYGVLMQEIVTSESFRPKPSSLGALKSGVKGPLKRWCFEDMQRLALTVCTPPDPESMLPPAKALEDETIPAQGAILWAAATLQPSALVQWVENSEASDEARRRAVLAYARAAHRHLAVDSLTQWLSWQSPSHISLLAALELLRLDAHDASADIRNAAKQLTGVEALTLNWIADVLDGKVEGRR